MQEIYLKQLVKEKDKENDDHVKKSQSKNGNDCEHELEQNRTINSTKSAKQPLTRQLRRKPPVIDNEQLLGPSTALLVPFHSHHQRNHVPSGLETPLTMRYGNGQNCQMFIQIKFVHTHQHQAYL